jgi:long-chain acyl-CoA synthetase
MASPDNIATLVDIIERSAEKYGPREAFGTKTGGQWVFVTYSQVKTLVDDLRGGLASLGVSRGDRVAIISDNRIEWAVSAYATYSLGAAYVPMYESQLEKDWEYIVRDSGAKVLLAATPAIYEKVRSFPAKIPSLAHVVLLTGDGAELTYKSLLQKGAGNPTPAIHPDPKDMACLIYTSGTTGDPKGVILTHENVVSNVRAVQHCLPIQNGDKSLAFLPWAHSFGHTGELHLMFSLGAALAICEGTDKIVQNLAEVKPTILFAVPRIFNRIYGGVQKQMEAKPAPIRALFYRGLRAAAKKRDGKPLGALESAMLSLADKLVFSKVRARFGGNLKYAVSGAAALAKEVAEFVDGLGIMVYEGYGLTETSPIVSVNIPGRRKIGSVGPLIEGVRVVIDKKATGDAKQGEIVVYGPNVMQGYYNRPKETADVFTADGGFRTGDMGYLDEEGYLFITGRIKEQYKLENGKYVVPSPLEESLKLSPFIANVMIHGDNRPFNVALVVPEPQALADWAKKHGMDGRPVDELLKNEKVRAKIREELDKHSAEFKGYEKIANFVLVSEDFTQQNDMLTPSLKLKRRNVLKKWEGAIQALYV